MVLTSRCDAVVYVCEPGSVASITQMGEIKRVRDPTANSNSITTLFTELAVVQNYGLVVQAFGVVLSGMAGIDGVEGARELAEAGGIIIVQDPATSEFPDMPNNVIAAVADTEVRAPEAMCATIERFLPGVRAGEVFHKCPECAVTCADAAATQRALVLVRESMPVPAVDVRRVVERTPRVLIMTPAEGTNACEVTKALAEALGVELDDESVRDVLESAAEVLFEEPATIRNAVREMEPLNRSHPTLASFVAEHAEALVAPGIRASLAQTLAMRKSYRAPPR